MDLKSLLPILFLPGSPLLVFRSMKSLMVKDNRLKRQKEQELLKKERALKKAAMSEAQKQLQEESKKKVLKARREEEEIQKQMVKLRKEVVIKRHFMEEARKMERKRHNLKQMQRLLEVDLPPTVPTHLEYEKEGQRKDKQIRTQELLSKIDIANQKCLQKYFSAWYKLLLDLRVKMGKARALADWKCQLKALRAWRDYTWSQKLEQETKNMENQLRDQNRKKQLAIAFSRKCILHRYFVEWQCWSRTEVEKRELELKKEETKKKMAKLLEEVVHGKCATACSCNAKIISETKEVQDQPVNHKEVAEIPLLQEEQESTTAKIERSNSCSPKTGQQLDLHSLKEPKWAWQVTLKHATLNMEDRAMFGNQTRNSTQRFGNCHQKIAPPFLGAFESRHAFQKQLIEEQRRQLQEQQNLILAFQENERIKRAREDAKQATAATKALDNPIPKKREGKQLRENYSDYKNTEPFRSENHQPATQSRKKVVPSPHPLLKAMEERAIQRAERKKELEEAKKKREEEKLAQMQAEVEERQRQQVAEKEAQLEKRREEKRLQKMKELDKQRRLEREQELLSKAKLHYEKVLLKKRGLEPWRRLLEQSQQNMVVAQRHHCSRLQKGFLLAWLRHIQEILAGKRAQAEELYSSLLLRRSFRIWIQYKDFASTLEDNARKIYETSLKKKVFWAWFDVFNEEKSAFWEKQKMADQYSNRRIMRTTLKAWRRFPVIMKVEREKEGRLEQLRKRVTEILPDFHL
ncbi:coiled-coil domain-containing protein 191 isoform X2 [Hemicordylus capensis]|uniref:coiled-coil domain-containing protein 191 isoform X2 n=1 Tax=Hemicordylus capensis TaxID=884348 RepID=UPI002302C8DC|nr:coiled-coil domain-containing protein 191 isoform X2 [Hemicordylus capensis]